MCILTFQTVIITCRVLIVFLPSFKTNLLPIGTTSVVTKVVMSWLANDVTVLAIVTVSANKSVIVFQFSVIPVNPIGSGVQGLALGDSVKKELGLIVTCNKKNVVNKCEH